VNDSLAVCGGEAIGDSRSDLHHFLPRHARCAEGLPEVLTIQQLSDSVGYSFIGAEIMDGKDVWMIQLGNSLCLSLETCETIGILSHSLMKHLNRNVPIQPLVVGAVHHPHPAGADLLDDAVVAEGATDHFCH